MKKTIIQFFTAFTFLTFIGSTTFSQEKFVSGYVVDQLGDTLRGYIDYRNWGINPEKVLFKVDLNSDSKVFTPADIREFSVNGEIYFAATVDVETTPTGTDDLKFDAELKIEKQTVFLQTLVNGDKSLFFLKTDKGRENFYIKENGMFTLLIYKRYLKNQQGTSVAIENKRFLGQLTYYLKDCAEIESKIKKTEYTITGLMRLFSAYGKCTSSNISFEKKEDKFGFELLAIAGCSFTNLSFSGKDFAYLEFAGYEQSTNVSLGASFNIILPRNNGKWSIYNELLFSSFSVDGFYNDYESDLKYVKYYTKLEYSYLKMNNMIRFKYPFGHFSLFVNGGMSNGFVISEKNYLKRESMFYTIENTEETKAIEEIRKYEQGYVLGLGSSYKNISLELRYEKGNGMSSFKNLNSTTKRIYLLVGYKF